MALNWFTHRPARRARSRADADAAPLGTTEEHAPSGHAPPPSWPDVVRQLGQEVATSLNTATEQLDRLNRLEPGLVRSLGPLSDAIDRARQAGMAAQHVLRLCEDPPTQHREALNLADVARAVLTTRADWLARRQIRARQGLAKAQVYADASLLYMLTDELMQWAGSLSGDIAITVDTSSRSQRPRLRVVAWCQATDVPEAAWRGMRWMLWHELARAVGALTQMDMLADQVRVTVSLPAATQAQISHAAEESGTPSSVSAVIQGARVLVISASAQRRAQCVQALAGYGVVIDGADDMRHARQQTEHRIPDALIYDSSVPAAKVEALRDALTERSATPPALIEIDDRAGATEFSASTVGAISTGHVAASSLQQSLGPALVFELCKVI
ncbi:MAG: hypothetical protein Q4G71_01845 [Pseudomonadota bacterium]|nr:hypothetical protein [Pseudomonadota bacterium]